MAAQCPREFLQVIQDLRYLALVFHLAYFVHHVSLVVLWTVNGGDRNDSVNRVLALRRAQCVELHIVH